MAILTKVLKFVGELKPVTLCTLISNVVHSASVGEVLHNVGMLIEVFGGTFRTARDYAALCARALGDFICTKYRAVFQANSSSESEDEEEEKPSKKDLLGRIRNATERVKKTEAYKVIQAALSSAWEFGKTAVAACASFFLMFIALIGSLCPSVKPAKVALAKFMDYCKAHKCVKYASETSLMDYDTFKAAVDGILLTEVLGEEYGTISQKVFDLANKYQSDQLKFSTSVKELDELQELKNSVDNFDTKGKSQAIIDAVRRDAGMLSTISNGVTKLRKTVQCRIKPVVLVLAGEPGVGKSTLIKQITDHINQDYDVKGNDVWTCTSDHQDGLANKPVLVVDEFGLTDLGKDAATLQRLADTAPFHPNMDAIEYKQFMVSPRVIIVCTNHENIYAKSLFPSALSRRIDFHMLMDNPELMRWKTQNAGTRMSPTELQAHFKKYPSRLWELPDGAVDWNGACFGPDLQTTTRQIKKASVGNLLADIMLLVKANESDYSARFQSNDRPIFAFFGEPGTGKTTLAQTLKIPNLKIYDDPQADSSKLDDFIADCLNDDKEDSILVCANKTAFEDELRYKNRETHRAVMRRIIKTWNFSYQKSGYLYGHYGPEDVKTLGWSATVRITCEGREVDVGHPKQVILESKAMPKYDYKLPDKTGDTDVLAEVRCKVAEVSKLGGVGLSTKVSLIHKDLKFRTLWDIATIAAKSGNGDISGPEGLCHAVNCHNLRLTVPNGLIKFEDCTLQKVSTNPLRLTIYEEGLEDNLDPMIIEPEVYDALWSILGTLIGLVGICVRSRDVVVQSPDAYDASIRGTSRKRTVVNAQRMAPQAPIEYGDAWGDNLAEIDYTQTITFEDNTSKFIYGAFNSDDQRLVWCVATNQGVLMNNHAIEKVRKIGAVPLGPSEVGRMKRLDIVQIKSPEVNRLNKTRMAWGHPIPGEKIHRVNPDGTSSPVTVFERRMIPDPENRMIMVYLCVGEKTVGGDCGLPYIRVSGKSQELVGLHSGMLGTMIMISPVMVPADFQIGKGEGKTYLYKTQFNQMAPKWLPACKKSTDDNLDTIDVITMNAQPMFARVRDIVLDIDIDDAVNSSIDYMRNLVPTWSKWGWKAALKSLDWTTSAGPSYKRTKDEIFTPDCDPKPQYEKIFFNDLKHLTAKCEIVIKDEMRKPGKIETVSSRLIYSYDVGQVIQAKQFLGSIQATLIDTVGEHFAAVGVSYITGTWGKIAENLSRFKYHIDADFAAWDKSMTSTMLDKVMEVFTSPIPDRDTRNEARHLLRYLARANTQLGTTRQGLPSGMPCTSHLNSTAHLIMINYALAMADMAPYGSTEQVWFTSYGDDFVCGTNSEHFLQCLIKTWKIFGFTATNPQKTGPPAFCKLEELTFLKRRFSKRADGMWMAPLEIESIMKSVSYTRTPVPYICDGDMRVHELVGKAQEDRLQVCFSELYQHGEEVFNKYKQQFIELAGREKFRLAWCIPPYKRFRIRSIDECTSENQFCTNFANNPITVQFQMETETSATQSSRVEGPNGAVGLIAGITPTTGDVAGPTVGLEHGVGTTGGQSILDPAIRERWAPAPGGSFTISNLTPVGTKLWEHKIDPSLNAFTDYIQHLYNAWGGGFELQVFLGANNFIGGKIGIFFIPPGIDVGTVSLQNLLSFPKTIIDIRTCDMMTFNVGDVKSVTWHQVGDTSEFGNGGTVILATVTQIVSSGAEAVVIDGRIMSRPANEFDFAFLKPPNSTKTGSAGGITYENQLSLALGYGTATATQQSYTEVIMVLPRANNPVNPSNCNTLVQVDGKDYMRGVQLLQPKCTAMRARMGKSDNNRWYFGLVDQDDEVWDPANTTTFGQYSTKTLPPWWVGTGATEEVYITWYNNAGANQTRRVNISFNPQPGNPLPLTSFTNPPDEGVEMLMQFGVYTGNSNVLPDDTWNPPNGESVIVWSALDSRTDASLQTLQLQAILTKNPVALGGSAYLFNINDGGNPTGFQAKMYPNGVTTTAGTTTGLVFSNQPTFDYVGTVSQDYRLPPITESAGLRSIETAQIGLLLKRWLTSQERSEESPLEGFSTSVLPESKLRTTSICKPEIKRSNEKSLDAENRPLRRQEYRLPRRGFLGPQGMGVSVVALRQRFDHLGSE